ncbi:Membrane protein insertase YidC [Buchnera aphidicola (Thelaxes suberi)]|uniref:membrane protein insertase YidC n=1 Tax=Buchnera aphidicola TaxID=9 RepID=UPI0034646BB9
MNLLRNFILVSSFVALIISCAVWKKNIEANHSSIKIENFNHDDSLITTKINPLSFITIKNDVIKLTIDKKGGDIVQTELLKFKDTLNSKNDLKLLETSHNFIYQAQNDIIKSKYLGHEFQKNYRLNYQTKKNDFILTNQNSIIEVPLLSISKSGIKYIKTFVLKKNSYAVDVKFKVINNTNQSIDMIMFNRLIQSIVQPKSKQHENNNIALQIFRGVAYSTDNNKYSKYKFTDIQNKANLKISTKNGWIAMLQKYFVSAWIPKNTSYKNHIFTNYLEKNIAAIGYKTDIIHIPAKNVTNLISTLWVGPEIQDKMAAVAPHLDLTINYGWLWFLSQPLFKLLKILNNFFHNWGFSIIAITFIMKLCMYPISKAQYIAISKIKKIQPLVENIKKKFAHDKQKLTEEMIILYKKEGVNPLGSLFPALIQMPLFLALYYMLMSSVELRHAPFILWIQDLSDKDPYYVLPICMGITMFFIQKNNTLNDQNKSSIQDIILQLTPFIFTIFFLWFPSGLVLYYTVSNLITIFQNKIMFKNIKV